MCNNKRSQQDIINCNNKRNTQTSDIWATLGGEFIDGNKTYELKTDNENISSNLFDKHEDALKLFKLTNVMGFNIISLNDDIELNNIKLVKDKTYPIKDSDKISVNIKDKKYEIRIQIKDYENKIKMLDGIEENLTCPICYNLFDSPVSIFPCFHTFCGTCIAQSYYEKPNCPICRQTIDKAHINRTLGNITNSYLLVNKSKGLSEEEVQLRNHQRNKVEYFIKDCLFINNDQFNLYYNINFKRNRPAIKDIDFAIDNKVEFKSIQLNLYTKGKPNSINLLVDLDSYETYMKYQLQNIPIQHNFKCNYCLPVPNSADRYQCSTNEQHICCSLCDVAFPKELSTNTCELCQVSYCPRCSITLNDLNCDVKFTKWTEDQPSSFPISWFWGNITESNIFKKYLESKQFTAKELYKTIVDLIIQGKIDFKKRKNNINHLSLNSILCNNCIDNHLFNELAYLYKMYLSDVDFSVYQEDTNMLRNNCWYGIYCKTQFHNLNHQSKLNHICLPTAAYVDRN